MNGMVGLSHELASLPLIQFSTSQEKIMQHTCTVIHMKFEKTQVVVDMLNSSAQDIK